MTNEPTPSAIRQVTLIGAGVIGASWAALFLAHGLKVCVNDPRAGIDAEVRGLIERAGPALTALGLPTTYAPDALTFETILERAVADADVVQENGPERLDFKRALWRRIEAAAPAGALLASSSSALPATEQSREMQDPGRLVIGHPFNPPHIIPLVEVVPGVQTSDETVQRALAFYRSLGKAPQVIHKEIAGFVANRLQSAIFRECVSLVAQGVVRIDELDAIVTQSVGLRWAAGGPFQSFYLGGGDGGLRSFVQQFGPGMEKRWASMSEPVRFDEATSQLLFEQSDAAWGNRSRAAMEADRDAAQIAILRALNDARGTGGANGTGGEG